MTEQEEVIEKLHSLPFNHFYVLVGITGRTELPSGNIKQPFTTAEVQEVVQKGLPADHRLGDRAVREVITDLETMGLVETWIESKGRNGRMKYLKTTFEPKWVHTAAESYARASAPMDDAPEGKDHEVS